MRISIIGSFQKYYKDICGLIGVLRSQGHKVLSPENSRIVDSVDEFVIFESDNKALTPHQIQTQTLNKILKSDVVYVYCPDGYIGRTTCYEIGVLRTTTIPLLFSEMPKDLPIYVDPADIVANDMLLDYLSHQQEQLRRNTDFSHGLEITRTKYPLKRVVICGSMKFYSEMENIKHALEKEGIPAIIPKEEDVAIQSLSADEFCAFKRKVSMQYLSKIRDATTFGVLIVNNPKNGVDNYIGTNTLVEISMAFCWGRPIYLFNDFFDPMRDELEAWNTVCLNGDLSKLIEHYRSNRYQIAEYFKPEDEISGQLCFGV